MQLINVRCHKKTCLFGFDQVSNKHGCTAIDDDKRLETSDIGRRGIVLCSETKALIDCMVTVQLICDFVFAHALTRFSHDAAQICIMQLTNAPNCTIF